MKNVWKWLIKNHPVLYEAIEWGVLALAGAAFGISVILYISSCV